jgi:molybdopterin-guanine dinucleotide biosynthesis protein MobB
MESTSPNTVPAIAFIGRKNSGKTSLVVPLISELTSRGYRVGSVKHHSHDAFGIDVPGKDSFRHREAGSVHSVIASPAHVASIRDLDHELKFDEILETMTDVDVVLVEGYRYGGIPTIEIFRSGSERDVEAAGQLESFVSIGVATDMPSIEEKAAKLQVPCFDINDIKGIADFVETRIIKGAK